METLEHLLRADLAVQKLAESAQKIYLTVPEGRKDSFRGHINFWSKDSFTTFLETNCPAKQVEVEEVNSEQNLLATLGPK
jgi:transposase